MKALSIDSSERLSRLKRDLAGVRRNLGIFKSRERELLSEIAEINSPFSIGDRVIAIGNANKAVHEYEISSFCPTGPRGWRVEPDGRLYRNECRIFELCRKEEGS